MICTGEWKGQSVMSRRLRESFGYAFAGLWHILRTEPNFRIHLAAAVLAIIAGGVCGLDLVRWCVLAVTIGMVLVAEAFNTAVEALVDLASPENHPLAKVAKDVAAGGVLLAVLTAIVVGVILFLPDLLALIE